jgi:hypothetical protein
MAFGKRMESFIYPEMTIGFQLNVVWVEFYIYHGSTVLHVLVCPLDKIT